MNTSSNIKVIKRHIRVLPMALLSFFTVAGFQNCGGAVFRDSRDLTSLSTGTCTTQLQVTQKKLRIIFMIDNSTSTYDTDPGQYYRRQTIEQFISTYGAKQNLTYAFGIFSGTSSRFFDQTNTFVTNPTNPMGNSSLLSSALARFSNTSAGSYTPFGAAITGVKDVILADLNQTHEWEYVIVFMSDGNPTDIPAPEAANLRSKVSSLMQTVEALGSKITFNTAYFGPANETDWINNLVVMADEGKGQFIDTNTSSSFIIDDLITIPGQTCTPGAN